MPWKNILRSAETSRRRSSMAPRDGETLGAVGHPAPQEKRVAVRGRPHDRFGGDIAARAWPVLDDEWLTKTLRQPLPIRRATVSDPLPAASPTMMRTGRDG